MTGKTAFVTGASGFIGVNLVKQLGEAGWSVIAMHRETSDLTYLRQFPATRVVGDIGDREFLGGAIPEGVDAVFHVAGNVSFDSAGDEAQTHANVLGTRAVVEVAKARNVGRFIHTSTGAVFGLHDGVPIDETAPSNADEIGVNYCSTKKAAEDIVLAAAAGGLDAVCVNPGSVVGPYDRVIWGPFVQAIASGAMRTVGTGGGAFCHIDETAKAHIGAYELGRRGERYILAGANENFATAAAHRSRTRRSRTAGADECAQPGRERRDSLRHQPDTDHAVRQGGAGARLQAGAAPHHVRRLVRLDAGRRAAARFRARFLNRSTERFRLPKGRRGRR